MDPDPNATLTPEEEIKLAQSLGAAPVISERADELSAAISREMSPVPTADDLLLVRRYYTEQRDALTRHVAEIEGFLGFVTDSDNLAARVAKIEAFLGLKG